MKREMKKNSKLSLKVPNFEFFSFSVKGFEKWLFIVIVMSQKIVVVRKYAVPFFARVFGEIFHAETESYTKKNPQLGFMLYLHITFS